MTSSAPIDCAPAEVRVHVAPTGNGFMRDIADWIVEGARLAGRDARLGDELPAPDGRLHLVVAPHEYFELVDAPTHALQRAAAASVCVCTEQPGTPWFHLSVDACRRGIASLDINPQGVDALRAVGVDAAHLRLGGLPSLDRSRPGPRPIDVLFLGGLDDRRGALLADLAPRLVPHRSELRLFRFDRPVTPTSPGVVFGTAKYDLLASAELLLNLHRDRTAHLPPGTTPRAYFEWARMIEAMANGCVVVTEPSEGFEPLEPGVHFVEAPADGLADAIDAVLADRTRLVAVRDAAHHAVMVELPFAAHVGAALDRLEREVLPRVAEHVASSNPTSGLWRLGGSKVPPPVRLGPFRPLRRLQAQAKQVAIAENTALRRLDGIECLLKHGTPQHVDRIETPAYAHARPEVSVVVSVYNYGGVVAETLDSIAASEGVPFEVIVVEDHATDDSRAVVAAYLEAHPEVPMVLLGKDANEGLAAARNTGFEAARAELVMVMDADNHIYPTALAKLAAALHDHPDASAAYSVLEDFGSSRNIRSAIAWEVDRLCVANYIDAQSMWRRSAWRDLGGYRADDDHVYGWEDWDLWLRLASRGGHARLVPEILGRYRVQAGSMIALTNLATDDAIDAMRARHPSLPWPPLPPR
ncbi:MAG: glycosyltransferase [Acidimicrobiales bacterium]